MRVLEIGAQCVSMVDFWLSGVQLGCPLIERHFKFGRCRSRHLYLHGQYFIIRYVYSKSIYIRCLRILGGRGDGFIAYL